MAGGRAPFPRDSYIPLGQTSLPHQLMLVLSIHSDQELAVVHANEGLIFP